MKWLRRLFRREPEMYPFDPSAWNCNVITYQITDPIWYTAPNGDRVQVLPDGSQIRYSSSKEDS